MKFLGGQYMKKVILCIFCLLLTFSLLTPKGSASALFQPRYSMITRFDCSLVISSDGHAQCLSEIRLRDSSYNVDLTMELQRSENGHTWDTVKSWDTSAEKGTSFEKGWYVSSGYSYRVYAAANIYTSSGTLVESEPTNSMTVNY